MKLINNAKSKSFIIIGLFILSSISMGGTYGVQTTSGAELEVEYTTISGKVLNTYKQPVVGVTVEISHPDGNTWTGTTNENGHYSIGFVSDGLLPATFTITIARTGYQTFSETFYVQSSTDNNINVNIDAELVKSSPGDFLFEGKILEAGTNNPIENAHVQVFYEDPIEEPDGSLTILATEGYTDANGYFYTYKDLAGRTEYYGVTISKDGYAKYRTVLSYTPGADDYQFRTIEMGSGGYVSIHGSVDGKDQGGAISSLSSAFVEITRADTGAVLVEEIVDIQGNFYYVFNPMSTNLNVNIYSPGYENYTTTVSANAGDNHLLTPDLDIIPQPDTDESWFNNLVSKIKEIAWDQLEHFVDNGGLTFEWHTEFEFGIKAAEFEAELDVEMTYSDDYEITIHISQEPVLDEGTKLELDLPGPLAILSGEVGFDITFVFSDPDHDLTTFNPRMVIKDLSIDAAKTFGEDMDLDDLIESMGIMGDDNREKIEDFIRELEDYGVTVDFSALVEAKIGIAMDVNADLTVQAGESSSLDVEFESIVLRPYFSFEASLDIEISVDVDLFDDEDLSFTLAEATLTISFNTLAEFSLIEATYAFQENELQINVARFTFDFPYLLVKFEWNAFGYSDSKTLVDTSLPTIDTGWWWSTTISFDTYSQENIAPEQPTIDGSTSPISSKHETYTFSSSDADGDTIQYHIEWGDGDTTTSQFVASGSSVSYSNAWSSPGTYTLSVKVYDGEDYSTVKSIDITVQAGTPGTPDVDGPQYVELGNTGTWSAQATDPNGADLKYTFTWGDGTSTTTGWVDAGSRVYVNHEYTSEGSYYLVVSVENTYGITQDCNCLYEIQITNDAPNTPSISGPSSGYYEVSYQYTFDTSDPDGDNIRYRVQWGDGSTVYSSWKSSGSSWSPSHTYTDTSSSSYTITIQAYDEHGEWSSSQTMTIYLSHATPPTPSISGDTYFAVGETRTYTVQGYNGGYGSIQYTVHWGDGSSSTSGWKSSGTKWYPSHTYTSTGSHYIVVEVRNSLGNGNEDFLSVSVVNSAPDRPDRPYGPSSGTEDTSYSFRFHTDDPNNHRVRYKIDWGDGSYTTTGYYDSGDYVYRSHSWSTPNVRYYIKVKAQDAYGAWSSWSYSRSIDIEPEDDDGGGYIIMSGPNIDLTDPNFKTPSIDDRPHSNYGSAINSYQYDLTSYSGTIFPR